MMAVMDRDLRLQTETFTDELFQGRITDGEKAALERWLAEQLEQERQGWKKKVQMSLKEVEKERKLALDVHAAVHRLNDKFQPVLKTITLFREPSLYQGADTADLKVNHIPQLEKNLDAILTMLGKFQEERVTCFQILGYEYEEKIDVADLVSEKVTALKRQIQEIEKTSTETEKRLLREIKILNNAVDLQQDQLKRHQQQFIRDLESVNSSNTEYKTKSHSKYSTKSTSTSDLVKRVEASTQARRPHTVKHSDTCSRLGNRKDKGIQTINYRPPKSKDPSAELSRSVELMPPKFHDKNHDSLSKSLSVERIEPEKGNGTNHDAPISAVTIIKTPYSAIGTMKTPPEIMHNLDILHKGFLKSKQDMLIQNGIAIYDRSQRGGQISLPQDQQTVDYLRSQVLDYAGKLEQVQHQMETYQQQLALLRSTKVRNDAESRLQNNDINQEARAVLMDNTSNKDRKMIRKWQSEGYLGGKKVDEAENINRILQSRTSRHEKKVSGMAKCLRCNRMYRIKTNNMNACKYHSKQKETVEKYDSVGKLVKIIHMWTCCNGNADSPGCKSGQHV